MPAVGAVAVVVAAEAVVVCVREQVEVEGAVAVVELLEAPLTSLWLSVLVSESRDLETKDALWLGVPLCVRGRRAGPGGIRVGGIGEGAEAGGTDSAGVRRRQWPLQSSRVSRPSSSGSNLSFPLRWTGSSYSTIGNLSASVRGERNGGRRGGMMRRRMGAGVTQSQCLR